MARPWRAGGDRGSYSFPALPWKRKKQHKVEVHDQWGAEPGSRLWYFSCSTCGMCGPLRRIKDVARHESQWHEENA